MGVGWACALLRASSHIYPATSIRLRHLELDAGVFFGAAGDAGLMLDAPSRRALWTSGVHYENPTSAGSSSDRAPLALIVNSDGIRSAFVRENKLGAQHESPNYWFRFAQLKALSPDLDSKFGGKGGSMCV